MIFERRGLSIVLSSPSGAGKSTLSRQLLALEPDLKPSISVTTRAPRGEEQEGKDYYFISHARYKEMIEEEELLEYAMVHDNGYGTPRAFVENVLKTGKDILFDLDWQGAQQLRQSLPSDLVTVFILPPSGKELRRRLISRATDRPDVVEKRLKNAPAEINHWPEYDYVLINNDVNDCMHNLRSILQAERIRRRRQLGLVPFIKTLIKDLEA
jgi:guanylate kinase